MDLFFAGRLAGVVLGFYFRGACQIPVSVSGDFACEMKNPDTAKINPDTPRPSWPGENKILTRPPVGRPGLGWGVSGFLGGIRNFKTGLEPWVGPSSSLRAGLAALGGRREVFRSMFGEPSGSSLHTRM